MRNVWYHDEDGGLHLSASTKKPLIDIHWELRAVVLWLMRASILVGAALQLRHSGWPS